MVDRYLTIIKYIKDCYEKDNFNSNVFRFYKTRAEKGKNRVGIINYQGEKFFFKIIKKEEYNDENVIKTKLKIPLRIVDKYCEYEFGDNVINLYKYINTIDRNAFNFLRNNRYSFEQKNEKLDVFFKHIIQLMNNTCYCAKMDGNSKSDRWFWMRICRGNRATNYYGNDFKRLLEDIKKYCPESIKHYRHFFKNIYNYLSSSHDTVYSYNHGDFHDFNFCLDGLFWDVETFGFNPILNDFVVYYWHFYGREDHLIYKYSPWLVHYMKNTLDDKSLYQIRQLKENMIKRWFMDIQSLFYKYNLENNIYEEFVFKLFCRVFLIDNILNYEKEDKKKIYRYFHYFLENSHKDVGNLLFNNPIKF